MVFQRHHHPALFGFGDAFLDALDAPLESIILRMAGQDRLDPTRLHQVIETLDCAPAAGVEADAGYSQFVGDLQALVSMLDLFLPFCRVRLHEVLMNRKADRGDTVAKGVAFELLKVAAVGRRQRLLLGEFHLLVQDVKAFDTDLGSFLDDSFNRDFRWFEMPVGVGGDAEFDALFVRNWTGSYLRCSVEGERGAKAGGGCEKGATI